LYIFSLELVTFLQYSYHLLSDNVHKSKSILYLRYQNKGWKPSYIYIFFHHNKNKLKCSGIKDMSYQLKCWQLVKSSISYQFFLLFSRCPPSDSLHVIQSNLLYLFRPGLFVSGNGSFHLVGRVLGRICLNSPLTTLPHSPSPISPVLFLPFLSKHSFTCFPLSPPPDASNTDYLISPL